MTGSGLSGVTWLSSGEAMVTVRPRRISVTAASTRCGVMLFSAPRRSAGPQRDISRSRWYKALKAAASKTAGWGRFAEMVIVPGPFLAAKSGGTLAAADE